MDEIEALIYRGHLACFVVNKPNQAKPVEDKNATENLDNNRPTAKVITMIYEGAQIADNSDSRFESPQEESLSSKKAQTQDTIVFTDEDLRKVRTPHNDPVIVSLIIANYDVKRILVDNRSSVDILFYDAFQRMQIPYGQLQKINAPLVGFIVSSI